MTQIQKLIEQNVTKGRGYNDAPEALSADEMEARQYCPVINEPVKSVANMYDSIINSCKIYYPQVKYTKISSGNPSTQITDLDLMIHLGEMEVKDTVGSDKLGLESDVTELKKLREQLNVTGVNASISTKAVREAMAKRKEERAPYHINYKMLDIIYMLDLPLPKSMSPLPNHYIMFKPFFDERSKTDPYSGLYSKLEVSKPSQERKDSDLYSYDALLELLINPMSSEFEKLEKERKWPKIETRGPGHCA